MRSSSRKQFPPIKEWKKSRNALFRSPLKVSITLRGRFNIWPLYPFLCPAPVPLALYLCFYCCAALRACDLLLSWRKWSCSTVGAAALLLCVKLFIGLSVRSGLLSESGHSEVVTVLFWRGKTGERKWTPHIFEVQLFFKWIRLWFVIFL